MRRAVFHQQMKHRAKWGERGIMRESRDGFKRKIKIKRLLPVHCSGSSHVHQMNVELQLVNRWRVALARFWHVCLGQNDSDAVMFFWRCWWQSSSFTWKCSRNKGKTKEMFKCIVLTALFKNTRILKFKANWHLRFSLPSIILDILAELIGNTSLLRRVQKVMVCDLWLVYFDPFCVFLCFKVCCLWS